MDLTILAFLLLNPLILSHGPSCPITSQLLMAGGGWGPDAFHRRRRKTQVRRLWPLPGGWFGLVFQEAVARPV